MSYINGRFDLTLGEMVKLVALLSAVSFLLGVLR